MTRTMWTWISMGLLAAACGGGGSNDMDDGTDDVAPPDAGAPDAAPLGLGAVCDDGAACASGHCVSGVCCAGPCDAACETGACLPDGACELAAAEVMCREAAGACDVPETCSGDAPTCPPDAVAEEAATCRDAVGDCDLAEVCDGATPACPPDELRPPGAECGAYVCVEDEAACPTSCDAHADCAADAVCIDGACTVGKWAFTTSIGNNGNLGGLAGADAFCQQLADAAGLRGTYKVWLSDAAASPATRFTQSTVPWFMPVGTTSGLKLADDWADLTDGTIDARFVWTETGVEVPNNIPFTNTEGNGTEWNGNHCSNWTSTAGNGSYGNTGGTDVTWTQSGTGGACSVVHRYYCFEQ
jgi:hypothetical protein